MFVSTVEWRIDRVWRECVSGWLCAMRALEEGKEAVEVGRKGGDRREGGGEGSSLPVPYLLRWSSCSSPAHFPP